MASYIQAKVESVRFFVGGAVIALPTTRFQLSSYPVAVEHCERVEYILPSADSSSDVRPVFQRISDDEVEYFECGLLVGEMSAPVHRVPESRVQAFDGV